MAPFITAEKDAEKDERRAKEKVSDCEKELAALKKDKATTPETIAVCEQELAALKAARDTASDDFEKARKARREATPRIDAGSGDDD